MSKPHKTDDESIDALRDRYHEALLAEERTLCQVEAALARITQLEEVFDELKKHEQTLRREEKRAQDLLTAFAKNQKNRIGLMDELRSRESS